MPRNLVTLVSTSKTFCPYFFFPGALPKQWQKPSTERASSPQPQTKSNAQCRGFRSPWPWRALQCRATTANSALDAMGWRHPPPKAPLGEPAHAPCLAATQFCFPSAPLGGHRRPYSQARRGSRRRTAWRSARGNAPLASRGTGCSSPQQQRAASLH